MHIRSKSLSIVHSFCLKELLNATTTILLLSFLILLNQKVNVHHYPSITRIKNISLLHLSSLKMCKCTKSKQNVMKELSTRKKRNMKKKLQSKMINSFGGENLKVNIVTFANESMRVNILIISNQEGIQKKCTSVWDKNFQTKKRRSFNIKNKHHQKFQNKVKKFRNKSHKQKKSEKMYKRIKITQKNITERTFQHLLCRIVKHVLLADQNISCKNITISPIKQLLRYFQMKHLIIIALTFLTTVLNDEFDNFKTEMEGKVESIATEMQSIFSRRCQYSIATCQVLSYNDCEGTSAKTCHEDFPKPGDCIDGGAYLSEDSAIRFPNSVNVDSLSQEEKQFVCTSALLEESFKDLDDGRDKRYGKAYIGTNLGAFRSYPSTRQIDYETDGCTDYDPRFRPWYATATSGAKNVILLIDTSGSMYGERLTLAKDAATNVVNTLSNSDFVGVINFGSSASNLQNSKITRATTEVKEALITKIDALEASGQTNYEGAFTKGLALLKAAQNDEYGAPCSDGQNVFLFLTDGEPTVGLSTSADLINHIDSQRGSEEITIFTYALGNGISNVTILKELACEYSGIMFSITDTSSDSDLATVMKNYYTYISEGVTISSPVWTEPYEDAFGFGKMVTVSMPIYYTQNGVRSILGVAGIDILWEQIQFGQSQEDVIERLVSNAPCQRSSLTQCQIQDLRDDKCQNQVCTSNSSSFDTCNDTAGSVFKSIDDDGDNLCCSLTVGALVGIIIAIVVVLGVVIGIVVWKVKKTQAQRREMQEAQQRNEQKKQPSSNININMNNNPNNPYGNYPNPNPNPNPNPYINQGWG